jgi:hypothetical protein
MKNFFRMKKHHNSVIHNTLIVLLFFIFFILACIYWIPWISALTGNYSIISPFSCGANCIGGYELFGHTGSYCSAHLGECFNTIDGCKDGYDSQFEWVEDITITDLNGTSFLGGDTVDIDAYVNCDSDGDWLVFAYNNGSGFRAINVILCAINGKVHRYYDFNLDQLTGNHTVRVAIAYAGGSDFLCGEQASYPKWADTDDVTFFVQGPPDNESPSVTNPTPSPSETYEQQDTPEVLICADAIDNYAIDAAFANISWASSNELMQLEDSEVIGTYCANFSNTSKLGTYNVSFIVNDTSGNINDSVTTFFIIENTAVNITVHSPGQGGLFAYGPIPFNFTLRRDYDVDAVFYSVDGGENTTVISKGVNVSFTQPDADGATGENTTDYANLAMSFKPAENMSVNLASISLKRSGSGAPDAQLQIRTDDSGQPSDTILAYGNITNSSVSADNYSFINITLNTTLSLVENTFYWLVLTGNSITPDFYSWESSDDGLYADGDYNNNAGLDLLFIVYDRYNFRTVIEGLLRGEHNITVYANSTSTDPIYSPQINFNIDYTPPVFNDDEIIMAPDTDAAIDPGVALNFTGSVTDDVAVQQVIIQYKKENESDFQNATTTLIGDLFNGSITPDSEGVWIIRLVAWDTSDNIGMGDDLTLNITYEYTWSREPDAFDTTSALLDTNATIGNITITNTGDFVLDFNISKTASTIHSIYFNNTPDSTVINLSPGETSDVSVIATGQSIESNQKITILIDALNAQADPDYEYTNFTFISYVSGPYLDIEITEYDASVAQGQVRIGLTVRITNAGNETANNVSAYWSLPSGWSARTNLTANYSTLGVGQEVIFTRYVDVDSDAPTGDYNISVYVNCSEGKSDSEQRSVNVNSSGEEEPPVIIKKGGGGGGAALPAKITKLNIAFQNEVEIERGANKSMNGTLKNIGDTELKNIALTLEGFPLTHYKISPGTFDQLKVNATEPFSLLLNIPEYFGSGKQEATLVVKALAGNALREFTKNITIIVVTEDKASALACFEDAAAKISEMESKGMSTATLSTKLEEAKKNYESKDYPLADNLCKEILKNAELAAKVKGQLDTLGTGYANLGKEVPELGELIKLSQEAFEREDYTLASQRAEQAEFLISMKEEEVQQTLSYKANFIKEHWNQIIPILILIVIIGIFMHSSASLSSIKQKIIALESRKENIKNRVKENQHKYFSEKTISDRIYNREMEHYRSMLSEIEGKQSELELRKLKIVSGRTLSNLEKVRHEAEAGKKELQRKYFVEKSIGKQTFKKLSIGFDNILQDIDKKIALKKNK